ncbi:terpene synthase family protein [Paenarthrobacter sp. NPDC089989]|uniref:terpene synthase family protein n=1 Tax=unclassified Paenarthrobacter TaxID=2634190 RepID=UPI0038091D40
MSNALPECPGLEPNTTVSFPPITQRFSCGLHPDYYQILGRHEDWVRRQLLPNDEVLANKILKDNLSALFVCMSYYDLDAEKVLDICDLTDWLFIHDNDVAVLRTDPNNSDSTRQAAIKKYLGDLQTMLAGGVPPEMPWAMESIYDLISRFRAKSTPAMFEKLVGAFRYYSTVTIGTEASELLEQKVTDLESYMDLRSVGGSSATLFFHVVTEYVLGVDLSPEIVGDELVQRYWRSVMDHWYLPNDLLSFRAECARGDHNNAICVLRRTEGLTLQEALDRVARMIDQCQDDAVRYFEDIQDSPLAQVPGLLKILETFQHIGAANQRWSYMAPRYHGDGFVWNGVLAGDVRLTATHTFFPDVPVVADASVESGLLRA